MVSANDEYLTLSRASDRLPGRPHPSSVYRFICDGVTVPDGRCIRLGHLRVGRRLFTTPEMITAFIREVTEANTAGFEDRQVNRIARSPRRNRGARRPEVAATNNADQQAQAELEEAGF